MNVRHYDQIKLGVHEPKVITIVCTFPLSFYHERKSSQQCMSEMIYLNSFYPFVIIQEERECSGGNIFWLGMYWIQESMCKSRKWTIKKKDDLKFMDCIQSIWVCIQATFTHIDIKDGHSFPSLFSQDPCIHALTVQFDLRI